MSLPAGCLAITQTKTSGWFALEQGLRVGTAFLVWKTKSVFSEGDLRIGLCLSARGLVRLGATLLVTYSWIYESFCWSVGLAVWLSARLSYLVFLHFETCKDILRHFVPLSHILRHFKQVFESFREFLRVFAFCLTRARDLWRWPCSFSAVSVSEWCCTLSHVTRVSSCKLSESCLEVYEYAN